MRLFVQHANRTVIVALGDGATMTDLVAKCVARFHLDPERVTLCLDVAGAPVVEGLEEVRDGERLCVCPDVAKDDSRKTEDVTNEESEEEDDESNEEDVSNDEDSDEEEDDDYVEHKPKKQRVEPSTQVIYSTRVAKGKDVCGDEVVRKHKGFRHVLEQKTRLRGSGATVARMGGRGKREECTSVLVHREGAEVGVVVQRRETNGETVVCDGRADHLRIQLQSSGRVSQCPSGDRDHGKNKVPIGSQLHGGKQKGGSVLCDRCLHDQWISSKRRGCVKERHSVVGHRRKNDFEIVPVVDVCILECVSIIFHEGEYLLSRHLHDARERRREYEGRRVVDVGATHTMDEDVGTVTRKDLPKKLAVVFVPHGGKHEGLWILHRRDVHHRSIAQGRVDVAQRTPIVPDPRECVETVFVDVLRDHAFGTHTRREERHLDRRDFRVEV